MRGCRARVVLIASSLLGLVTARGMAQGQPAVAPCTTANAVCTEWIGVKGHPQQVLVYRSYPLDQRNERIVRALVMVHGGLRLAADQFTNELRVVVEACGHDDRCMFTSNQALPLLFPQP